MGVIYKLREEVVDFIINQRQSNPLASCRQLAESASQKFTLNLSKSSVHDVLKESGIVTPRGRKPKNKFEIPQEKKNQIKASLSQIKLLPDSILPLMKLLPDPVEAEQKLLPSVILSEGPHAGHSQVAPKDLNKINSIRDSSATPQNDRETSPEYEGAGRIFLKAALWDLGIFSEENIKATDWDYYLTYSKGIKVALENNKSFFIDLPLPLKRCIREVADGLINNVKPLIVHKVSDEGLFKACMNAQVGFKIDTISIVDCKDHILLELNNIMELNRRFILQNRVFVESSERNLRERSKAVFFSQLLSSSTVILSHPTSVIQSHPSSVILSEAKDLNKINSIRDSSATPQNDDQLGGILDNIYNSKGFDATNKDENSVTLLISDSYENRSMLQGAAEKLNGMYLRDEQDRLVSVKIQG